MTATLHETLVAYRDQLDRLTLREAKNRVRAYDARTGIYLFLDPATAKLVVKHTSASTGHIVEVPLDLGTVARFYEDLDSATLWVAHLMAAGRYFTHAILHNYDRVYRLVPPTGTTFTGLKVEEIHDP